MLINRKGQSTIEYIILVAAVIAVMIFFAGQNNTGLQQRLNNTYDIATNDMQAKGVALSDSHSQTPQAGPGNPVAFNPATANPLP